jgi:uncharacterized membrane protein
MQVAATGYDWLLFLHVLAAMIWLGGIACVTVLAGVALRSGEPDPVGRFIASLRIVGPLTLGPASFAVLGFGIWLVVDSDAWDFGRAWIIVGLALLGAAFLVGGPVVRRAATGARRATDAGDRRRALGHLRRCSWGDEGGAAPSRRRHLGHGAQTGRLAVNLAVVLRRSCGRVDSLRAGLSEAARSMRAPPRHDLRRASGGRSPERSASR